MSPSRVLVATAIVLGDGVVTLTSTEADIRIEADITTTGAITLDGAAEIDTRGAARELSGGDITLVGRVRSFGANLTLTASGTLTLSSNVDTRDNTDPANITYGNLSLTGATIQIVRVADAPVNTRILLRGENIILTSTMGIQIGRFNGRGEFQPNNDVARLTVNANGALTIAADITVADGTRSGGAITLTDLTPDATPTVFTGARTITGAAITLSGAATGTC